jgi:hypothetical protein
MALPARRRSPAMRPQTYRAPFKSDTRIDYALIVIGVGAALFAFIYLILI